MVDPSLALTARLGASGAVRHRRRVGQQLVLDANVCGLTGRLGQTMTDRQNNPTVLSGVVRSGMGNFGLWIAKLQAHYRAKTGMTLFPGTLNLELAAPFPLPEKTLRLEGHEYGGTVSVSIVPCRIFGRKAFILRTDANERGTGYHPRTIIEVATDVKLRDHYSLTDGDRVDVEL